MEQLRFLIRKEFLGDQVDVDGLRQATAAPVSRQRQAKFRLDHNALYFIFAHPVSEIGS